MEIGAYQFLAMKTALPTARNLPYMVLGLTSESGEVAGKLKKALRDNWSDARLHEELVPEVADTLWYLAGICEVLGVALEDAARGNLEKLRDRQERGVLGGSGDTR